MRPLLFLLCLPLSLLVNAQVLTAHFTSEVPAQKELFLYNTVGSDHTAIDSVVIDKATARFNLKGRKPGFYQLALNDSDRMDLIIDPSDTLIEFEFSGIPLQRSLKVLRSDENLRLWEYKMVSRQAQAVRTSATEERKRLQPTDILRAAHLDSMVGRSVEIQREQLIRLSSQAPGSVFGKVVRADMALENTKGKNPMTVAEAFNFSSGVLLRSSVYDKAVMYFLNNLNAISEEQFSVASDTLIVLASRDPECRAYMIEHLIDLFSTYGPDIALQHLVNTYVVPAKDRSQFSPRLLSQVDELLKVSVGSMAPDVDLPLRTGHVKLQPFVSKQKYTVLFFYASTCDHCHAQMPRLKELYATYHSKGLEVVGIALDVDSAEFETGLREKDLTWPSGSEFNGWGSTVAKAFRVKATPWFYLIDKSGRIAAKPYDSEALGIELAKLIH